MREILKQMVLLEDHLFQSHKRCKDCIRKHFLTIEALAEECVTLCDPHKVLPESRRVASLMRAYHHAYEAAPDDVKVIETVANRIRMLRKDLMRTHARLPPEKLPHHEAAECRRILDAKPA
jgi:hypothetical protein